MTANLSKLISQVREHFLEPDMSKPLNAIDRLRIHAGGDDSFFGSDDADTILEYLEELLTTPTDARLIATMRGQIIRLHDELELEHNQLSSNWLGLPKRRHHQIIGASRALKELWERLNKAPQGSRP